MPLAKHILPIGLITLSLNHIAIADEIKLKNGDTITGTIVKKETDKLIVNTSYAGEISITWTQISSLNSTAPVNVVLTDQSTLTGMINESEPGRAKIKNDQLNTEADINLAELNYINPSPLIAGTGIDWKGRINFGGAITQGNTDTSLLRADAEAIARTKDDRLTLGAIVNRAKSNDVDTEYNSRGDIKYDHFLTKKWYVYANTTLENDRFRDIDLRTTVGVGNGYQIYEQEDLNLFIEGGVNYIDVNYNLAEDDSYASGRWALRYDQKPFKTNVQVFHQHEVLFALDDISNTLIFSKTGLRVPVTEDINASTQINLDYNNQPAAGRRKLDKALLFSLGYSW
jgi:putative salt-induced outer membrane protein YdiY